MFCSQIGKNQEQCIFNWIVQFSFTNIDIGLLYTPEALVISPTVVLLLVDNRAEKHCLEMVVRVVNFCWRTHIKSTVNNLSIDFCVRKITIAKYELIFFTLHSEMV